MWPLVHYGLVRRYGVNHWRFAGFAMYSRPADVPRLTFAGHLPDGPLTQTRLQAALGDDIRIVDRFIRARKLWGKLEHPDPVGRLILERMPELPDLVIVINTVRLAPRADYLSYTSELYRCTRPRKPGGQVCWRP